MWCLSLEKKLMEIWYLQITENFLFWTFCEWKIRYVFELKRWWKDDIYWLLKSFLFELFGDGKCGLFSAKKLMEKWYLLGLFDLFMIFQDLRNMAFCAVIFFLYKYYWSILWWSFCNFLVILSTIKFSVVFEFFKLL